MWQTLLGGLLALTGGFGVAMVQARQQTRLNHEKDIRDRRAALYLDLLANLSGRVTHSEDPFLRAYGPTSTEDYALRNELTARVALFASPEVRGLWTAATEAAAIDHANTVEGGFLERDGTVSPSARNDPDYARLADEAMSARRALEERLRKDLGTDRLPSS
ncbi:hypothetical protein ACFY8X_29395 [Streptomyces tanashiensis]|uniref:hypothetical protein n=1 Tax=Streptomyces tanashiensis TaxID=67367 RepID=UPI0036E6E833